jgi:WD40 repeat protein/tRNA A-37 threonylcarbamoyl transferase component Bud32
MQERTRSAKPRAEHYRRVMSAFEAASSATLERRSAILEERCGGDEALRREVEAMLAHAVADDARLRAGAGLEAMMRAASAASPPRVGDPRAAPMSDLPMLAGQYRILRMIGEGGSAVVYEAEQAIPRRRVALKAIRSAFASRQMLLRFEQEAHILGRLHHPGVAQIYEAGAADAARGDQAYFAMELVEGLPLTAHAERHRLGVDARLELMIKVCDAVQHAHQRGVIHRDLKPSNILVDAGGQPKVLDFGVARLEDVEGMASASAGSALETRAGQLIGTLAYMSPEQVAGDAREIDTRSDVYTLGVLLYELLTGAIPHPMRARSLPQMLAAIRDEDAPRVAATRHELAGDVDAIVAMALERDKRRRYQSASELGADLERHLAGEPVLAKQHSAAYLLRKQVYRHRYAAAAIAAALVALVAFAGYNQYRANREERAKRTALDALREADLQRSRADASAHELAGALRTSNIERGRLLGVSGNLRGAEELIWNEHLARATPQSHWALWDLYSRYPCTSTLGDSGETIVSLARSPDGKRIAAGSHDKIVRVFELEHAGESISLAGHDDMVFGVAFSPRGDVLYSASVDGVVRAWDVAASASLWSLRADEGELMGMAVARDGKSAALSFRMGVVRFLDLENRKLGASMRVEDAPPMALCFDARGETLVGGSETGILRTWDVASAHPRGAIACGEKPITALAASPDGSAVACGSADGALRLIEWPSRLLAVTLPSDNGPIRCASFSADGDLLLAAGSQRIDVWDLSREHRVDARAPIRQPSVAAAFDSRGASGRAIVSGSSGGTVRVWELDTSGARKMIALPRETQHLVALCHDGSAAATTSPDGGILWWSLPSGELAGEIKGDGVPIRSLAHDPFATRIMAAGIDGNVRVWKLATRTLDFALETQPGLVNSARFSYDGELIACGLGNGTVRIYDAKDGTRLRELAAGPSETQRVVFSPDTRRIASTQRDRSICVWSLESGAMIARFDAPDSVWSLAFVRDSPLLVVGTWGGALELWDVDAKRHVRTISGHAQLVQTLSIANESLIASGSVDGTVKLWDAHSEVGLATLDARAGAVENLLLSDDGRRLTSVHADGALRIWDLTYFDRHIQGNAAHQVARRNAERASAGERSSSR